MLCYCFALTVQLAELRRRRELGDEMSEFSAPNGRFD